MKNKSNLQDHSSLFVDFSDPRGTSRQAHNINHVSAPRTRGPTNVSDSEVIFHVADYLYNRIGQTANPHNIQLHFIKGRILRGDRIKKILIYMCDKGHIIPVPRETPKRNDCDYHLTPKGNEFYESHFEPKNRIIIEAYLHNSTISKLKVH
jgi:hypothetical protein